MKNTNSKGEVKYFYADVKAWQTTFADESELLQFESGQVALALRFTLCVT